MKDDSLSKAIKNNQKLFKETFIILNQGSKGDD